MDAPTRLDPTVRRYVAAMQTGAMAEQDMMALFTEDAVYVEPFSGAPRTHEGKPAIRRAMVEGWKTPLPDMRLEVDRVDVDGEVVRAQWTCISPALPGGKGRGENTFTLREGRITRLETRLLFGGGS